MAEKRILIVDDSFDLTKILKTAIHTLNKKIKVKIVPSAEEALLEFNKEPLNLVISDVRLPGISGLEFLKKIRKRDPNINILMITGLTDLDLEEKAKEAGANFFLRKPIEIPLFMDAISTYLGVDISENVTEAASHVAELPIVPRVESGQPQENLTDTLVLIRKEIAASTVYLLNENGKIAAQTGESGIENFEEKWLPLLLPLLSAGEKFSKISPIEAAQSMMTFRFDDQDVILLLLSDYALVIVASNGRGALRLPLVLDSLSRYQTDLMAILGKMGAIAAREPVFPQEEDLSNDSAEKITEAVDEVEDDTDEGEEDLDSLLNLFDDEKPSHEIDDVDEFWEKANDQVEFDLSNPDVISYEQAEKLGLTPDDAEKKD